MGGRIRAFTYAICRRLDMAWPDDRATKGSFFFFEAIHGDPQQEKSRLGRGVDV